MKDIDSQSELVRFLSNATDAPYRLLIQRHMRTQSARMMMAVVDYERGLLPEKLRPKVIEFIDAVNGRFGYDANFWRNGDCKTAFGWIIQEAIKTLPISDYVGAEQDAYRPENHALAFGLFQIATLSFAYSASLTPKQRKFMGIRKSRLIA